MEKIKDNNFEPESDTPTSGYYYTGSLYKESRTARILRRIKLYFIRIWDAILDRDYYDY